MKKPMNVLFMIADQHGAKFMGHTGHPDVKTPNLDRLAKEGVSFSNAICQNPICTPSRMSLLSGQYCHNHGHYNLRGIPPAGLPSFIHHFRNFGYRTGMIGKMHLPEYWAEDACDVYKEIVAKCSADGNPHYVAYLKERGAYERYMQSQPKPGLDGQASIMSLEECYEGFVIHESRRFIEESAEQDKPFILHASFQKPHQPYTPVQPFWDMYNPDELTLPVNAEYDLAGKSPALIEASQRYRESDFWIKHEPRTYEAARRRKIRGYLGGVSQVDYAVGQLLDCLKQTGQAENTIVVYTSDHGEFNAEHGVMDKVFGICSDAATRVPQIWRVPGVTRAGLRCAQIVEGVDVSTTLCSLAGVEDMPTSDGVDLSPLLHGENVPGKELGVTEMTWARSVRYGKYRLMYYPRQMFAKQYPDGFGELYDLEVDPWEMHNLYVEPEHRERVVEIERKFMDWLVTTTRPVTSPALPKNYRDRKGFYRFDRAYNADGKIKPALLNDSDRRQL